MEREMNRIFRAEKMIARVTKEGKAHLLDAKTLEKIHKLDGKIGSDYNWESYVNGKDLIWIPKDEDTAGAYVALVDTEPV